MEQHSKIGIVLVLWATAAPHIGFAADAQVSAAAVDFLSSVSQNGETECREDLAQRRDTFLAAGAGDLKPLAMIIEAQRLQCESLRLAHEVGRLALEAERLGTEAAKIEEAWQRDHAAAPLKIEDYPGRDRSQMLLKADQQAIETTISVLEGTRESLEAEALRVLLLAGDDLSRLTPNQQDQLRLALDAGARHSIFDLLRQSLGDGGGRSS